MRRPRGRGYPERRAPSPVVKGEAQKQREAEAPLVQKENAWSLERQIVRIVGGCVEPKGTAGLFATLFAQLRAIVGPDQVAEVFEQFDNRESLLRRPIRGNGEGDCQEQPSRGWWAHDWSPVVLRLVQLRRRCSDGFGGLTAMVLA
jgi:hypothetical protein